MDIFTQVIVPIIASLCAGGGIAAVFKYLETRPQNRRKAKLVNVTAETQLGEAWFKYAEQIKKDFDTFKKDVEAIQRANAEVVKEKDGEISVLRSRVLKLERLLEKYTGKKIADLDAELE